MKLAPNEFVIIVLQLIMLDVCAEVIVRILQSLHTLIVCGKKL